MSGEMQIKRCLCRNKNILDKEIKKCTRINTLKENIIKRNTYEQYNYMALITFLTHQVAGASLGIKHCILGHYKVAFPSHPIKLQYI